MHQLIGRLLIAPTIYLLAACSSPLSPTEIQALAQAEARWAARPFQNYTYEIRTSCGECPEFITQWARVAVSNGVVVEVRSVANDSSLAAGSLNWFTTVDGLFAQIRQYQDEDWVRDVTVTFDPQLGYPTSISTSAKPGIMDAGGSRFIQNVLPQP